MPVLPLIDSFSPELTEMRRDFHEHPELGFEEVRTAGIVAQKLSEWGVEVHRGIGGTGIVGVLQGNKGPGRRIGLRADMDALPIEETTNLPYRSKNPGKMHACGHDAHTTMLLGAARYLAATREFCGTAIFIFQPAEEGLGGSLAMLSDKLFERFPCDEIYALHNSPYLDANQVAVWPGRALTAGDFFDIKIKGLGSHGAVPSNSRDPIIAAIALVTALQTIVSRNIHPVEPAVVSVTQIHSGSFHNVIPEEASLAGTIRTFSEEVSELIRKRMREIADGVAVTFGVEITVDIRSVFRPLINHEAQAIGAAEVAREIVGNDNVITTPRYTMGSEDFADMLKRVPGAYCYVGHAGTLPLHNPGFVLDDAILPVGASLLARLVETRSTL